MIAPSARREDTDADYEPFPKPGEPVFTSHPAFIYDTELRKLLNTSNLYLLVLVLNKDKETADGVKLSAVGLDEYRAWVFGETPIPDVWLTRILEKRKKRLVKRGLSPDLQIGWEKLEQIAQAEAQAKEHARAS